MSGKGPSKRKQPPPKQIERKRSRRANNKDEAQPQQEPSTDDEGEQRREQQDYTELSAVGHILSDQIRMYASKHPLSVGELRQLSAWDDAVQTRIHQHNAHVLENVKLTAEYKKVSKKVSDLRDDLVAMRTSARRMKLETKQLEQRLEQTNEDSRVLQGASRFLHAVEKIGKSCRASVE